MDRIVSESVSEKVLDLGYMYKLPFHLKLKNHLRIGPKPMKEFVRDLLAHNPSVC